MPAGVEVIVDEGFATIDFVDRKLRGPGVTKLLEVGGPETIEKLTGGMRPVYRVPEGNAREAGLLDDGGPDGEPSTEWKLAQLKAYAADKGLDAHELRSKAEVLALINAPGDNPA